MSNVEMLAYLTSITDKAFTELFYNAVAARDPIGGEKGRHFVLAETSQFLDEERDTVFVALPDHHEYPNGWADESPICQTGQCNKCNSPVRCIAKHAICPICDELVYCS